MMAVYTARLNKKGEMEVPVEIRRLLDLQEGDTILYEVRAERSVTIKKAVPLDLEYLNAVNETLTEWNSAADEYVYRNL